MIDLGNTYDEFRAKAPQPLLDWAKQGGGEALFEEGEPMFIVETQDDLWRIDTLQEFDEGRTDEKHPNGWLTLAELADSFDVCDWFMEGRDEFVTVYNGTGPTWFIPKVIAEASPNVIESIRLSTVVQQEIDKQINDSFK